MVEVTAVEIRFYQVIGVTPPDIFHSFFSGSTLTEDDYKEEFIIDITPGFFIDSVVVQDELHPWIWDGRITNALGDNTGVAQGTIQFGRPPDIHLVGQQVALNQTNPPFGAYALGDVVEHQHPNGTSVRYRSGYTALNHGPQYDMFGQPFGDFDYSNTESWYWYHVNTVPEQTASVIRRSYVVNFRRDFMVQAELQDFEMALNHDLEWNIRIFRAGTQFTIADARLTPVPPELVPTAEQSGTSPHTHTGTIRRFTGSGFVA